jgi:hypothetical protein
MGREEPRFGANAMQFRSSVSGMLSYGGKVNTPTLSKIANQGSTQ